MQREGSHSTFHGYARRGLVAMHRYLGIKDAQSQVPFFGEADVRVGSHAMARPVPERVFYVLRNVPAVMPVKIIVLVHPTPGICRSWPDERVFFPGPCTCTISLADFAIRHTWLDARTAERMHNGASLQ